MTTYPAPERRPLRLGFAYQPGGSWPDGWRRGSHDPFSPEDVIAIAQTAERAGFDFLLLSDRVHDGSRRPAALPRSEPFTSGSFVATRTSTIGIVVTANTSYSEPFNLARITASLDHVTHGRAGWAITTGISHPLAHNFSREELGEDAHLSRATEVVGVVRALWDSWEDDAFIRNKTTGEYVDGSKIHAVNHQGALFSIKGPLNVARPPQGQLVVAHDIAGPASITLAAAQADIAFAGGSDPAATIAALRTAATTNGRGGEDVLAFVTATVVVGGTVAEAEALRAELGDDRDVPGTIIVGDAPAIAEGLVALADGTGAQGVLIHLAYLPDQLERFADLVTPELRARGLLPPPGAPTTLRARLGLPTIANRLVAA